MSESLPVPHFTLNVVARPPDLSEPHEPNACCYLNSEAVRLIQEYGPTDGAHHKQWVIDQVLRVLTGTEDQYLRVLSDVAAQGCAWDEGTAP